MAESGSLRALTNRHGSPASSTCGKEARTGVYMDSAVR